MTKDIREQPKDCPFCGSEARLIERTIPLSGDPDYYAECSNVHCHCNYPAGAVVLDRWNRRAYEQEIDALKARIAELEASV